MNQQIRDPLGVSFPFSLIQLTPSGPVWADAGLMKNHGPAVL